MAKRGVVIIVALLGLAFAVSIAALGLVYVLVNREPSVPSHALLVLRISGDLSELAPVNVVGFLSGTHTPTVRGLVDSLRKAKVDPRVGAVLVRPMGLETPYWAKIQELRDAMVDYRASGKPLYAYLEYGSQRDYYLASAADKIFLMPSSALDLTGVSTAALFLRGTFDKIGVYPDFHHIGNYKTAPNTYTEKTYTAAHREMDEALNRSLYDQIVAGIATGRHKNAADVRALVDDGPFLPENAKRVGLVDEVAYEDEVMDTLRTAIHGPRQPTLDGDDYARVGLSSLGLNRGPRIAVIYATGTIASGKGRFDPLNGTVIGSDTLIGYIRQARRDATIRAIVLRIDSPGGSAAASDAIWRELVLARREREDRPLVASMSDLAASGGYYIAMPAQTIVAQPATITGSIGIFGGKFVTAGAYEKLGANVESTSIGRRADMESPSRRYTKDEEAKLQEELDAFYGGFVAKAASARRTTPDRINRVAQGRVWTGAQALEQGLVDELGGLDRAIAVAKKQAGIAPGRDVELVVFPPRRTVYELLSDQLSGGGQEAAVSAWVSANLSNGELDILRAARGPSLLFRRGEPLALMPFRFLR